MLTDSKRKIRAGGHKGAVKVARMRRQKRLFAVERNLGAMGKATVAELAKATERSPAVVRAALKESRHAVKRGDEWHFTAERMFLVDDKVVAAGMGSEHWGIVRKDLGDELFEVEWSPDYDPEFTAEIAADLETYKEGS